MAVYPEGNPGVAPYDPMTPVGLFRVLYGDTESTPYDPVEPGYENYEELSDAEIEGFIAQGGDSVPRGIGYLYLRLAGEAAIESQTVQDYDLRIDLTKKAGDLRAIAAEWFSRAEDDDDRSGGSDIFEVFDTVSCAEPCELCESRTCHCY